MTNHIENMMRTAGVEEQYYSFMSADGNTYTWELNEDGNEKYNMRFIGRPVLKQRNFTTEKQLEIIKLIGDIYIQSTCIKYGVYAVSDGYYDRDYEEYDAELKYEKCFNYGDKNPFEQALAQLTTELMNTGDLGKQKVKEILER